MNKQEFLEDLSVKEFVIWLGFKLDKPKSFIHSYTMKRGNKTWNGPQAEPASRLNIAARVAWSVH